MSKKRIIVMVGVGLVSFAGAFVFACLTKKAPVSPVGEPNQPAPAAQETELRLPRPQTTGTDALVPEGGTMREAMTEKQLKYLVYEVQEKMHEYSNKLKSLEAREGRLQMAHETLKKDIENLSRLRTELAATVAALKDERDKLLKSQLEIAQAEKANLAKIAATYDKMDSASASKIITSMCTSQKEGSGSTDTGGNMDDAVKILHYMTERTKAKVLSELVALEPKLAATLCEKLKQVVEKK